MKKILFNEKETAAMTGRGVQTLRNERNKNQGMPYHKIGRRVLYSIEDIRAFIDNHRIIPSEQ